MTTKLNDELNLLAEYASRPTLAKQWGTCTRTIGRYEKEGLPSITLGGRKLYPLEGAMAWLKNRES